MGPGRAARLWVLVLVGVGYYLGARLGLGLSLVEDVVTPLWPPTGIALAAFLIWGRWLWPVVFAAAFAVNLPLATGPVPAFVTAAGNTAAPFVAAVLLAQVGFRRELDRKRDALAIVFLGALVSMLISAVVGTGTLALSGAIPAASLPEAFAVWWTGDAMGVLVVTPFLLALPLFVQPPRWTPLMWVEGVAVLVLVSLVASLTATTNVPRLFLVLPFLGWAAWRFQLRGAAPAALAATLVVTWAASRGFGPFVEAPLSDRMFTLQAFNACVALTSFFFAALVSERNVAARALEAASAQLEDRVRERTAQLSAANARLLQEIRERSQAQELLSVEAARAAHDREVAETLQRSLLPEHFPAVGGVAVAARYVPASTDDEVGGGWYDVLQLAEGRVGIAIGDVSGHGVLATAAMAQVRVALRAHALQDLSPASVLDGVHRLMTELPGPELATVTYLVLDPARSRLTYASTGNPPALLVSPEGAAFLHGAALGSPVGVLRDRRFAESEHELAPGTTLVLFTDGLVERREVSVGQGLDRLATKAAALEALRVDELADRLIDALVEPGAVRDDVALVVVRPNLAEHGPLHLRLPAQPRVLTQVRSVLRSWLRDNGVHERDEEDVLVACGEACANVVRHAYGGSGGDLQLDARLDGDRLELIVSDAGVWQGSAAWAPTVGLPSAGSSDGGWGLQLMRAVMDTVDVTTSSAGTAVTMSRHIARDERPEPQE